MDFSELFPSLWKDSIQSVAASILTSNHFLVSAHARLDGDAYGSIIATAHLLCALKKEFVLYAPHGVPEYLDILDSAFIIRNSIAHLPFQPQTLLALDCGVPDRLGEELAGVALSMERINIDHHQGKGMGTRAAVVCPEAASTTQVLSAVYLACGLQPTPAAANALALGLLTDTGFFRHSSTTASVFALAAYLEHSGARFHLLRERLEKNWTIPKLRLWSVLEGRVRLYANGTIALCSASLDDFKTTRTGPDDAEGFIDRMRDIKGVAMALLVREQAPGVCKVSMRSGSQCNVCALATQFGGGGHVRAAGATIRQNLPEACETILAAAAKLPIQQEEL